MATLRPRLLLLAAVVAVALLALAGWRFASGPSLPAYRVERGDIVQSIVATGRVESPRRVDVASAITGTVVSIPVAEGQAVRAGQLLVALDPAESRAAMDQARFAVAQAEAKIAQLRSTALPVAAEAVRQAQANLANAERALARSKELFARGFVGQAALDEAQRSHDVARSQLAAATLQRDSQSEGGAELRLAQAALDAARASLQLAQARLDLTTVEAPSDGILISRNVEKGAVAQPGKTLMVLSPAGETQLVVQIDEKNLHLLEVGQAALASADAYPDRRFEARVAYINPAVDPLRGSVEVKLSVPKPPGYLLQDMTVSVDIEAARRAQVLALSSEALHEGDWVLAVRAGRAVRSPVKVGARGSGRVEIAAGLGEGELVLPVSSASVHDGDRVRAAPIAPAARGRP